MLILAVGTTAASSSDFTLNDGESVTLALAPAPGAVLSPDARVEIHAVVNGTPVPIGALMGTPDKCARVLAAPGTFRVVRLATAFACGVDKA